jgi:hypothetical protein
MRRIGSSRTPDEWILPVEIRRRKIEMDRTVFFIEEKSTKYGQISQLILG